jgi:hypothetical protein
VPLYPLLVEYLAHRALHQLGEAGVETVLFGEERIKYAADQRATTKDSGAATEGNGAAAMPRSAARKGQGRWSAREGCCRSCSVVHGVRFWNKIACTLKKDGQPRKGG